MEREPSLSGRFEAYRWDNVHLLCALVLGFLLGFLAGCPFRPEVNTRASGDKTVQRALAVANGDQAKTEAVPSSKSPLVPATSEQAGALPPRIPNVCAPHVADAAGGSPERVSPSHVPDGLFASVLDPQQMSPPLPVEEDRTRDD